MRRTTFNAALIAALAGLLLLTACGRNQEAEPTPPPVLRTPIPTFTPTVPQSSVAPESVAAPENAAATQPESNVAAQSVAPVGEAVAPAPTSTAGFGGPVDPPQLSVQVQPALGVINTQLVNARSGPSTDFGVVMILGLGENYDITGKSADGTWWRVCCVEGQEVWVSRDLLDATGNTESLPVAQAGETSGLTSARSAPAAQATITSQSAGQSSPQSASQPATEAAVVAVQAPAAAPQLPASVEPIAEAQAPAAAESAPNTLSAADAGGAEIGGAGLALQLAGQEQFPETNVVRVFLFVYQGTEALEGYTVNVTKDGVAQTASSESFGGRPGMTWPIAADRQRFQNLKVEFPGVSGPGTWVVTVMKDGAPAGPAATFTIADGDINQELYVRYALQ